MEIQTAGSSPCPVDRTSSPNEGLTKPAGRRPRRRAAGRGRRSLREKKKRGPPEKRRGQAEKRHGQREKRRGQKERRLEEEEEEERKEGVTVKRCRGGARRRWDKRHYCVFCRKPQVKMARHLLRKHRDQQEVAQASALPTGCRQRHLLLETLRCRGNYLHNIEVIRQGSGEIVPWRQPSEEVDARNYLPCPLCLGFFLRADLWKHQASCRKKMTSDPAGDTTSDPAGDTSCDPAGDTTSDPAGETSSDPAGETPTTDQTVTSDPGTKQAVTSDPGAEQAVTSDPRAEQAVTSDPRPERPRKRCRVQAAASRLLPVSSGASESCSEVLHRMNQDHVSHQVKSDWLICKYGNRLMGNQDGAQTRYDYVSQKLRELGRFLLAAKSLDSNVRSLQDVLAPPRLRLALAAARKASGYRWSRPPLAVKTALKTVCEIAIGESLQDGDWEAAAKTTDFYHLLGRDWDTLGCLTPDPVAAVGGAKLKKRTGQQGSEKECKDRVEEPSDLRSEVVPSESSDRQTTATTPPDFRLQTHINVPVASRKVRRRPWSSAEKEAVWRQLGVHVLVQSVPGKEVCLRCLDLEPVLRGRHWKDVKNHVHNQIQSQKKQQFHAQMDHQDNQDHQDQIQGQKKEQYHTQMDHQDHGQIQNQKKQQFHAQMDHQDQDQDQIQNQNQTKQQFHAQMDHQDQIHIQSQKKQQFHAQMDIQDHNQIHSQKKQQYLAQMDHQDQLQIQKKQLCHARLDHQDQIQSQKKQLYHPHMDHQDQGLQTGTGLGRDAPIPPPSSYIAEGQHRARDPIGPYPAPHRAPGPHMDGLLSRAAWTDGPLTQNYPISRQIARNPHQDTPPGGQPPNPHSGHAHF